MREKYESLSLAVLKDLAKARGMKGISTLRKPALIERMLEEDAKEAAKGNPAEEQKSISEENVFRGSSAGEDVQKENTLKEKKNESGNAEYRTRQKSEGIQEHREYRADKYEQEHRTIRREYTRESNREGSHEGYNRDNYSHEGRYV